MGFQRFEILRIYPLELIRNGNLRYLTLSMSSELWIFAGKYAEARGS